MITLVLAMLMADSLCRHEAIPENLFQGPKRCIPAGSIDRLWPYIHFRNSTAKDRLTNLLQSPVSSKGAKLLQVR